MNQRIVRVVVGVTAAVLLGLYLYAFVLHRPPSPSYDPAGNASKPPDLVFSGTGIEGWDGSEKVWKLFASRIEASSGASDSLLKDVSGGEIYRDGKLYLTFQAERGEVNTETGRLKLHGGVTVFSEGREMLRTDEVVWTPSDSKILVPGGASIAMSMGRMTMSSLEFDVKAGEIVGRGDLSIVNKENNSSMVVRSDKIRIGPDGDWFETEGDTEITIELEER